MIRPRLGSLLYGVHAVIWRAPLILDTRMYLANPSFVSSAFISITPSTLSWIAAMIAGWKAFRESDVIQLALQLLIFATSVWRKSNDGRTPLLCYRVVSESIASKVLLGSLVSESAFDTTMLRSERR